MKRFLMIIAAVTIAAQAMAQTAPVAPAAETAKAKDERLAWWRDGRFGMFIHWGPVSLKGTEISWSRANTNPKCPNAGAIPAEEYDNLYKRFDPEKFNAEEWVSIAKAAGMKYMVLTAKHCDGFLLWHSKASDYNISQTPFKRDICAELAKAAHAQGMKIGWYFSPMDWRDPDFRTERHAAFLSRMQQEIRELLSNYGTIDLLWFDWDLGEPLYDQVKTYEMVKSLQPNIIINNRLDLGPGHTDREILSPNADYYTPEQAVGAYDDQRPWESCMTLSAHNQWAWGGADDGVKPTKDCLEMLIRCAGGDGNVLLNVGPTPDGEIAPEQVERLKEMGAWLAKYGESIYGTRGGPFKPWPLGVSTRRGNVVYLHLLRWMGDTATLPALPAKVVKSAVLTGGTAKVKQTDTGITITLPKASHDPVDTIIKIEFDKSTGDIPAMEVPGLGGLAHGKKAAASNVYQNDATHGPDKAFDGDVDTRWATDRGTSQAWLEVDLGQPMTFRSAYLSEAFAPRVKSFELQYKDGDAWKTFHKGAGIGENCTLTFPPVTARCVRLNVLDASDGPTINEFLLFGE
jgi:alpha-L-fucosidase